MAGDDAERRAAERADDRATASGISPGVPPRRPVTTPRVRDKVRRRRPQPYNPPLVRPTAEHIEIGRAGIAAARAALARTDPEENE